MSFRFSGDDTEQWAPVSDLMAALMLVFMFIAIFFSAPAASGLVETAYRAAYQGKCDKIFRALHEEFKDDFAEWQFELLPDLTIRISNPKILFPSGSDVIPQEFEKILRDFFPRYAETARRAVRDYRDKIEEIRIEGHTSSKYEAAQGETDAYFRNMDLSQRRTRAILQLALQLPEAEEYGEWIRPLITANGLSSSRLILTPDGGEDETRSRRVEFRLVTNSCLKARVYESRRIAGD